MVGEAVVSALELLLWVVTTPPADPRMPVLKKVGGPLRKPPAPKGVRLWSWVVAAPCLPSYNSPTLINPFTVKTRAEVHATALLLPTEMSGWCSRLAGGPSRDGQAGRCSEEGRAAAPEELGESPCPDTALTAEQPVQQLMD